jgi:hypothetical protein
MDYEAVNSLISNSQTLNLWKTCFFGFKLPSLRSFVMSTQVNHYTFFIFCHDLFVYSVSGSFPSLSSVFLWLFELPLIFPVYLNLAQRDFACLHQIVLPDMHDKHIFFYCHSWHHLVLVDSQIQFLKKNVIQTWTSGKGGAICTLGAILY